MSSYKVYIYIYILYIGNEPIYAWHILRLVENGFTQIISNNLTKHQQNSKEFLNKLEDITISGSHYHKIEILTQHINQIIEKQQNIILQRYNRGSYKGTKLTSILGEYDIETYDISYNCRFSKLYVLLFIYSLIQFRNFKANNFNILYLIISGLFFKEFSSELFGTFLFDCIQLLDSNIPIGINIYIYIYLYIYICKYIVCIFIFIFIYVYRKAGKS